jgi:hypothetical protein
MSVVVICFATAPFSLARLLSLEISVLISGTMTHTCMERMQAELHKGFFSTADISVPHVKSSGATNPLDQCNNSENVMEK